MKFKFPKAVVLGVLVTFSARGQDSGPPDDEKVSYALGMKLGLEIKRTGTDVDVNVVLQAVKDAVEGKTTKIPESEVRPILQQGLAYQRQVLSKKNRAEGEAYLAKNAKAAGVTVLPDGLQYRVIQAGSGKTPKMDENVTISSHGTLIDGTVIDHKDHFQVSVEEQMKGFQEALQLMPVGSKWQIVMPPALAFGDDWKGDVGPDSTVIFELELNSIAPSVHSGAAAGGPTFGHQGARLVGEGQSTNSAGPTGK